MQRDTEEDEERDTEEDEERDTEEDEERDTEEDVERDVEEMARELLGCDCPPEVFETIEFFDPDGDTETVAGVGMGSGPDPPPEGAGRLGIRIGGRLMIEMVDGAVLIEEGNEDRQREGRTAAGPLVRSMVERLDRGRTRRDENDLNRFRLVAVLGKDAGLEREEKAEGRWTEMAEMALYEYDRAYDADDRIHVHVLSASAIPGTLRNRIFGHRIGTHDEG